MTQLFRKEALKKLETPEQLDRALTVTTSKSWLVLGMLTMAAAIVVVWSVVGEISTFVNANGIFLTRGGRVIDAVPSGSGSLARIIPTVGDMVEKDDLVAEIVHQEMQEIYRNARLTVAERARALEERKAATEKENALVEQNIVRQRDRLALLESNAQRSLEAASKRLKDHQKLFEDHTVTRVTVERSQQTFDRAQRELLDIMRRRDDLESMELRRRNNLKTLITEAELQLQAAQHEVNRLKTSLGTNQILAPSSGRVIEIKATIGSILAAGQPVLSIETGGEGLEVLVYVPPTEGKRIKTNTKALVSPISVRREKYGAMIGEVENISEFPSSIEGMVAVLQNRELAQILSRSGPPYESRITLIPDLSTASGYTWTSPKASEVKLTSGTLANVEIEVSKQPPIALVVPLINKIFGL